MGINGLSETEAFLTLLHSCQFNNADSSISLSESLQQALYLDGYSLHRMQDITRNLRGLSEESGGGGLDVTALIMVGVCILCAGFASGLTQGLLSLDSMEMEIKARSGTPEEKKHASKLIPIISHHHLLLVTLMLWNASATEALPIFLAALVPEWVAIIISVTLVLFVGEIIPASILTGPKQLQITASLTPLVYFVLVIFFPIAYPIALCLDRIIGHSDMTMYNRTEISTMMQLHREEGVKRATEGGHEGGNVYEEEEVVIIAGALKYREMAVCQVMTPAREAYMISVNEKLSYKVVYDIFKAGYSRIPVYEKDLNDIVGLILAKDLIFIDPEDETPVRSFLSLFGRKPAVVWHDNKLGETLAMFKSERSHMAIVRDVECEGEGDPYYKVVGIITLEDIVEEILGTEIEDEFDIEEEEQQLEAQSQARDPELARLRTITNATVRSQSLTDEEVHSIGIYLFTNVPQIQRLFKDNMADLQKLVRSSAVISMTRKAGTGEKPSQEDYLYRAGKMNNTCTLILSGSVEVFEQDNWVTADPTTQVHKAQAKGPWSTIAPEALESAEGTYVPSFSAYVISDELRFLCITNHACKAAKEAAEVSPGLHPHHHRQHLHGKSHSAYNMSVTESKEKEVSPPSTQGFNTITYSVVPTTTRKGIDTLSSTESPLHHAFSPSPRGATAMSGLPGTPGSTSSASTLAADYLRRRGGSWAPSRAGGPYTPSSALNGGSGFGSYGTASGPTATMQKGAYLFSTTDEGSDATRNPLLNPGHFNSPPPAPPAYPAPAPPPLPRSGNTSSIAGSGLGNVSTSIAKPVRPSAASKQSSAGATTTEPLAAPTVTDRIRGRTSYSPLPSQGDLLDLNSVDVAATDARMSAPIVPTAVIASTVEAAPSNSQQDVFKVDGV